VVLVHLLTFLQLTTDVCNAATVGEVFEADSSKAASYTGRIMPAWNQLRTACTEDFSQGAVQWMAFVQLMIYSLCQARFFVF